MTGKANENRSHLQFSIIIPTKNRAKILIGLIRQLYEQSYPKNAFEIIVVDNTSTDVTASELKMVRYSNLRVLSELRQGPSYCRNRGYRAARFDHVIFLDDDVSVSRLFLVSYERAWRNHHDAAAIGGRILVNTGYSDTQKRRLSHTYDPFFGVQDYGSSPVKISKHSFLLSSVLSVHRESIGSQVPFNTKFGRFYGPFLIYGEDYEFCTRLILQNKSILYVPSIRAYHRIETVRFSKKYIAIRSFLSGVDSYLEDRYLTRQFPSYRSETKSNQLLRHLFPMSSETRTNFFWHLHDPFVMIFLMGYFFLGPIVYRVSLRDR